MFRESGHDKNKTIKVMHSNLNFLLTIIVVGSYTIPPL